MGHALGRLGMQGARTHTRLVAQHHHTPPPLPLAPAAVKPTTQWAHWVCCLAFLGWTLFLLEYHFKQYVCLRQFYLRRNAGVNYWRKLHLGPVDGVGVHKSARMADVVDTARMPSSRVGGWEGCARARGGGTAVV